ncbi:MAG: DUF11 domain-containing protein [Ignavibacteria bacterium]|nr:DUF11 domain-containing protein [Ignavibacteria bacterium]
MYRLGHPPPGARVFACVDGAASNDVDYDLRLVAVSSAGVPTVLEYDDVDNDSPLGARSPNIAGTPANGDSIYLRITQYSGGVVAEPYHVYALVQTDSASVESEPNNGIALASHERSNYFRGALPGPPPSTDVDYYGFTAVTGDLVFVSADGDPLRNNTPLNLALSVLDDGGNVLAAVNDGCGISSTSGSSGTMTASTPSSPGEALLLRVPATGSYYVRVGAGSQLSLPSSAGDYLLSIGKNGNTGGGGLPADVAVSVMAPDSTATNFPMTYEITVRNNGPKAAIAVTLTDTIPSGSTFNAIHASQGSVTVPASGGTGAVRCSLGRIEAFASATVRLTVNIVAPAGSQIVNIARVLADVPDLVPANNSARTTTGVALQAADLSVTTTSCPDTALPQGQVTVVFLTRNDGPNTARAVVVRDSVPAWATFGSLSAPTGWAVSAPAVGARGPIVCTKDTLTGGAQAQFTVVFTLASIIPDSTRLQHCPNVASSTLDPVAGNNTSCRNLRVISRRPRIDGVSSTLPFAFGCAAIKVPANYEKSVPIANGHTAYNLGTMRWSATTSAPELSLPVSSGVEGESLRLRVNTTGLQPGTYFRTVRITASNESTLEPAENSPATLTVRIDIEVYPDRMVAQTKAVGTLSYSQFTNTYGQVYAEVRAVNAPIAAFTVEMHPCEIMDGFTRLRYVDRYFRMFSSSPSSAVDLRLYYTASDLEKMQVNNTGELRAWRQLPERGAWQAMPGSSEKRDNRVVAQNVTSVAGIWGLATPYATVPMPMKHAEAGLLNGGTVLLRWETDVPAPIGGMLVERQATADDTWSLIGSTPSLPEGSYRYADASMPGPTSRFRILAIREDGSAAVSDAIPFRDQLLNAATILQHDASNVVIFPNPFSLKRGGTLVIRARGIAEDLGAAWLYDLNGRLLARVALRSNGDDGMELVLPLEGISPGLYFVAVATKDRLVHTKLLVTE